ncbi:MAG TPA: hypothetical protein VJZ26_19175 [Blastocatellia bacterium]|nr:hypothetical protein [Blastocatellia bacterium]
MYKDKLAKIEQDLFDLFRGEARSKLLVSFVFASMPEHANADLVRAFEDLEKKWRLLVRYTDGGNDWVQLTTEGAARAGLSHVEDAGQPKAMPHPPKSST